MLSSARSVVLRISALAVLLGGCEGDLATGDDRESIDRATAERGVADALATAAAVFGTPVAVLTPPPEFILEDTEVDLAQVPALLGFQPVRYVGNEFSLLRRPYIRQIPGLGETLILEYLGAGGLTARVEQSVSPYWRAIPPPPDGLASARVGRYAGMLWQDGSSGYFLYRDLRAQHLFVTVDSMETVRIAAFVAALQ